MNHRIAPLLCLLSIVLLPLHAQEGANRESGAILSDMMACLDTEMETVQEVPPPSTEEATQEQRTAYMTAQAKLRSLKEQKQLLLSIQTQSTHRSSEELVQYTSRMMANTSISTACSELWVEYTTALKGEEEARMAELTASYEKFTEELGQALPEAKQASDLDPYFVRIQEFTANSSDYGRNANSLRTKLNSLNQIVANWQDYLAYLNAGDTRQATNELNAIIGSLSTTPVVPRSLVLERQLTLKGLDTNNSAAEPPYTCESVVESVKTIADLPAAREKLSVLTQYRNSQNDARRDLKIIDSFLTTIDMIESDSPLIGLRILNDMRNFNNQSDWYDPIKTQISTLAIYAAIPDAYRPDPMPEGLDTLVRETASEMVHAQAWLRLWEFLEIANDSYTVNYRQQSVFPGMNNDIKAIEKFIYAQRLERAGELADSLDNYQEVLQQTGEFGPYEQARAAIENLRGPLAEELLADQKRKAEVPKAPVTYDPRMRNMMYRGDSRELNDPRMIEKIVEEKVSMYLANEKEKKSKATTEKPAPDKPAPATKP